MAAQALAITALEQALVPQTMLDPGEERLCLYTPMPVGEFLSALHVVERIAPGRQFVDMGCGLGTKLVLADLYGFETTGVEIRPEYAEVARRVAVTSRIVEADVWEWPVDPAAFDVVYAYSPFADGHMEDFWEEELCARMRKDAILFLAYREPPGEWRHVAKHVWVR